MSKFEVVAKADGAAEITLYDVIDRFWGISAAAIYDQLKDLGDVKTIRVRINSPGGSVFEGTAIYNLLKQHAARVTVSIDGMAASMASVVAMAGDDIEIGEGAYLMIHDPLGYVRGGSEDMREMAELLDKMRDQLVGVYARRTSQTEDQIRDWMKAETWMTADEAVENGFANRSVAGLKIAAMAPVGLFDHPPQELLAEKPQTQEPIMADNAPKQATWQELKDCCPGADSDFLGKQMDAGATAQAASSAWMTELQLRAEIASEEKAKAEAAKAEAEKQAEEAKAEAEKAKAAKPGVEPLGGGSGKVDGDALVTFQNAVDDKLKTGLSRPEAVRAIAKERPELHAAYVEAHNANVGPSSYRGQRA
jgi:ATP-dependent Clp endopeptidase proteolytic subunit ClpP